MRSLLLVALLAATVSTVAAVSDPGVLYLDDITFDKIVDKSRDVLVRFDKEYPWGEEHDAFKELAKTVGLADTPLIVAGVAISNSETYPVNTKLAARFGLSALQDADFPRYKLFKRGADTLKPSDYAGDLKASKDILAWTVEQTGVFVGLKGQIKALDAVARRFKGAAGEERKALLAEAQQAADAVDASAAPDQAAYAEFYVRVMQRVLDKGNAYVEQEAARLRKLSEDASAVTPAKKETFAWRLNILASFGAKVAEEGGKGGKLEL